MTEAYPRQGEVYLVRALRTIGDKLLRHLNCRSKKNKVLWGGRPARPEYII